MVLKISEPETVIVVGSKFGLTDKNPLSDQKKADIQGVLLPSTVIYFSGGNRGIEKRLASYFDHANDEVVMERLMRFDCSCLSKFGETEGYGGIDY